MDLTGNQRDRHKSQYFMLFTTALFWFNSRIVSQFSFYKCRDDKTCNACNFPSKVYEDA